MSKGRVFLLFGVYAVLASALLTYGCFASPGHDEDMRERFALPSSWFTCERDSDCVVAAVPCSNLSLAVNPTHRDEVVARICKDIDCGPCLASVPDRSHSNCQNGQCVTLIPPRVP